jgi:hypothetical protein
VDLKVPIAITDELTEDVVHSTGWLDLASGEIQRIEYQNYDVAARGLPCHGEDYEFTSGMLSHDGKDVEFRVDVNTVTGQYSVSPSELLEIKVRAAALFAGLSGKDLLANAGTPAPSARPVSSPAKGAPKPRSGRQGHLH